MHLLFTCRESVLFLLHHHSNSVGAELHLQVQNFQVISMVTQMPEDTMTEWQVMDVEGVCTRPWASPPLTVVLSVKPSIDTIKRALSFRSWKPIQQWTDFLWTKLHTKDQFKNESRATGVSHCSDYCICRYVIVITTESEAVIRPEYIISLLFQQHLYRLPVLLLIRKSHEIHSSMCRKETNRAWATLICMFDFAFTYVPLLLSVLYRCI